MKARDWNVERHGDVQVIGERLPLKSEGYKLSYLKKHGTAELEEKYKEQTEVSVIKPNGGRIWLEGDETVVLMEDEGVAKLYNFLNKVDVARLDWIVNTLGVGMIDLICAMVGYDRDEE